METGKENGKDDPAVLVNITRLEWEESNVSWTDCVRCKSSLVGIKQSEVKIYLAALPVPLFQIFYLPGPQAWKQGAGAGEEGRSGGSLDSLVVGTTVSLSLKSVLSDNSN